MANSKGIFVAVVALVAGGAVGYMAGAKHLATPSGTEGTIGAASRYASSQIADIDVSVTDPDVVQFLESDLFHQMRSDPTFRKLVTSGQMEKLLQNSDFVAKIVSNEGSPDAGNAAIGEKVARPGNAAASVGENGARPSGAAASVGGKPACSPLP